MFSKEAKQEALDLWFALEGTISPEAFVDELGYPLARTLRGWTNTGMTKGQRSFCMGNALVMVIPHKIGIEIAREQA